MILFPCTPYARQYFVYSLFSSLFLTIFDKHFLFLNKIFSLANVLRRGDNIHGAPLNLQLLGAWSELFPTKSFFSCFKVRSQPEARSFTIRSLSHTNASMKPQNKLKRQTAWVEEKRTKSRARLNARRSRMKGGSDDAAAAPKRKPITLEDKRVWPVADLGEDDAEEDGAESLEDSESDSGISWLERDDDDEDEESTADRAEKAPPAPAQAPPPDTRFDNIIPPLNEASNSSSSSEQQEQPQQQPQQAPPQVLITTNRHSTLHGHARQLVELIPNSRYIPRVGPPLLARLLAGRHLPLRQQPRLPGGAAAARGPEGGVGPVGGAAAGRAYGALPPCRPGVEGRKLPGHGRPHQPLPELLLSNFATSLGRLVADTFRHLFPPVPEFAGRQAITVHNQRDFIYLRRHRYVFRDKRSTEHEVVGHDGRPLASGVKVGLQEIGPRLTLKLRRVDRGIGRASGQVWEWRTKTDKIRTMFQL